MKVLDKNAPFKMLSRNKLPTSRGFRKEPWLRFEIGKKCIKRILLGAVKSPKRYTRLMQISSLKFSEWLYIMQT